MKKTELECGDMKAYMHEKLPNHTGQLKIVMVIYNNAL